MTLATPLASWEKVACVVIVVIAGGLRVADLERNPPGFYADEASVGYDAWSLGTTGRDQYGAPMPLFARSLGDWDEASYRYLAVLPVAVLGPTVVATRLPAALAGVTLVLLLYFLARRWFGPEAAVAAGLLAAVDPWLVVFSRVAFRGILLPLAITGAVLLTERARTSHRGVFLAALAFAAALWTYSPARIVVPALLLVMLVLHGRTFSRDQRRELLAGAAVFTVVLVVLASFWTSEEGMVRAHTELRASPEGFLADYASYFSNDFLFGSGDPNLRHSLRGWGQMLPFEIVTIALGALACARRRSASDATLVAWLLLAPLPAALTTGDHALRAIALAPALLLLSGAGVGLTIRSFRGARWRRAAAACALVAFVVFGLVPVQRALLDEYPLVSGDVWQSGLREGIEALERTDRPCYALSSRIFMPHVFALFFGRVPPQDYQAHPIEGITEGTMPHDHYDIGPWRIRPPREAGRAPTRECAFLAPHQDREQVEREPGARVVSVIYGPQGQHWFDVLVFDP